MAFSSPGKAVPAAVRANQASLHRLPERARVALADALHPAFLAAALVCVIVFFLVLFWVKEVPLRKRLDEPTPAAELAEGGGGEPATASRTLR